MNTPPMIIGGHESAPDRERRGEELAAVLSAEHGKPLHCEARGELLGAADAFRLAAGQARWSPTVHFDLSALEKRLLARRRPAMLELGGNGPTIVLADADVGLAAERIARGSFTNAGQTCTAIRRVLVDERVANALTEALVAEAESVVFGRPHRCVDHDGAGAPRQTRRAGRCPGARRIEPGCARAHRRRHADRRPDPQLRASDGRGRGTRRRGPTPRRDVRTGRSARTLPLTGGHARADRHQPVRPARRGLLARSGAWIGLAEQLRFGHVNLNDASAYWEPAIPAGGAAGTPSGIGRSGGPWSVLEMTELFTMTLEARPDEPVHP